MKIGYKNDMKFSKYMLFWDNISKKMTCGSAKCYSTAIYTTIMVVLSLQLLSTIERQVFDFLGYMWAPIIGNFFQIVCTIFGIFGTYQYRPKFIVVYSTWSLIWLGWNVFVICLYLEVGVLNRNRELYILNMNTRNKSWWLEHGIGCKVNNDTWVDGASKDTARPIPPEEYVEGCLLDYYYVEVIHAAVQCLLTLTGFVFTCMAIHIYSEESESSTPANDELEFVKMHTLNSPRQDHLTEPPQEPPPSPRRELDLNSTRTQSEYNRSTSDYHTNSEYQGDHRYPSSDQPPSYETSMRNATAAKYYGSDRQSMRSNRSARSKASTRSKSNKRRREQRQEDLPWVQITPSASNTAADNPAYRHFP